MAMPLLFISCNKDEGFEREETVQISFATELPQVLGTRVATGLTVDKVVCAVFENDTEITTLRETITIEGGKDIVFSPRLIKGRKYDIVFWAYKDGSYDVDDMTAITRKENSTASETDFDAFTESVEITVTNSTKETVTLTRPLAQLNIGVTEDDWNTVVNKFNMTPTAISITINGKDTFNALTGVATDDDSSIIYNLNCSGDDLTVNNTVYKSIASCYVLPDAEKENFDITYTIKDQSSAEIRSNVTINSVPLQANYKTNVVGGLLTGTVTYNISLEEDFNTSENNKEIQ